jgi:hypothetical protein
VLSALPKIITKILTTRLQPFLPNLIPVPNPKSPTTLRGMGRETPIPGRQSHPSKHSFKCDALTLHVGFHATKRGPEHHNKNSFEIPMAWRYGHFHGWALPSAMGPSNPTKRIQGARHN